jgi:hypothetical protein
MSNYDWDSHNAIYKAAKWLPRVDVYHEWDTWRVMSRPDGQALSRLVCASPDPRLLCEMFAALQAMGWKQEEEE